MFSVDAWPPGSPTKQRKVVGGLLRVPWMMLSLPRSAHGNARAQSRAFSRSHSQPLSKTALKQGLLQQESLVLSQRTALLLRWKTKLEVPETVLFLESGDLTFSKIAGQLQTSQSNDEVEQGL